MFVVSGIREICARFTTDLSSVVLVVWLMCIGGCGESSPEVMKSAEKAFAVEEENASRTTERNTTQEKRVSQRSMVDDRFGGLTADEKLDVIAGVIRESWGDGRGFQFVPENQSAGLSEDPLVLTLRWKAVEKKIASLFAEAFGVEGDLQCRFTGPGEFECNNTIYELAIQRAQRRPSEYATVRVRVNATLVNNAPVLRDEFLMTGVRDVELYAAVRQSIGTITLPLGLKFSNGEHDSIVDAQQCTVFTEWTCLPAELQQSTEAHLFRWRLKLVIREAVDSIESETDNLRTEVNRLELVSYAQYQRENEEPYEAVGPLSVTAMGFTPDTLIFRWGKRYNAMSAPGSTILNSWEDHRSLWPYPGPAVFVGHCAAVMNVVSSVHRSVEEQLTVSASK